MALYGNVWSGGIPTLSCGSCGHVEKFRDDAEWLPAKCADCGSANLTYSEGN